MTHKTGNRYPEEFKQQIVDLYHAGTPVTKLSSEYGLIWAFLDKLDTAKLDFL